MKKITIEICMGTACFVMGSPRLLKIGEKVPSSIKESVEINGVLCCDLCRNWKDSKPPIARVNDRVISAADEAKILLEISKLAEDEI